MFSFIDSNPTLINETKILPKKFPDYIIFGGSVSDIFILANELFAKALQDLEKCFSISQICAEN